MIKTYALDLLATAMNRGLALDEAMPSKIQTLDGKVLQLVLNQPRLHFFMGFKGSRIQLFFNHDKAPDTVIKASPLGFLRLSLSPVSSARFLDNIDISGDVLLGQRVKKVLDELDIDWEAHLARFTGDVVAFQVGSLVRKGLSFTKTVQESMHLTMTEYLQEESGFFPAVEEVEDFYQDVDDLSLTVERLLAKCHALDKP